jgi:hypothetical protein
VSNAAGIFSTMPHIVFQTGFHRFVGWSAWLGVIAICSFSIAGKPATTFDFNGPETTWQLGDDDSGSRVLLHE